MSCGVGNASALHVDIEIQNTEYTGDSVTNDPKNYQFEFNKSWEVPIEMIGVNVNICVPVVTKFTVENGTLSIGEQLKPITFGYTVMKDCYLARVDRTDANFPVGLIAEQAIQPTNTPASAVDPKQPEPQP